MAELNLVVQFAALANECVFKCTSVNRRVGADFHIVFDRHAADLRNLHPMAVKRRKAETIGTDHAAGMKNDAIANAAAVVDSGVGIDN